MYPHSTNTTPNQYPNPDILIILQPKNDKIVVLLKFYFWLFSYLSNVNQLH